MLFNPPLVILFSGFGFNPYFQMRVVVTCPWDIIGLVDVIKVSFLIVGMFPGCISFNLVLDLFFCLQEVVLSYGWFFPVFGLNFNPVEVSVLREAGVDFNGFGLFTVLALIKY